MPMRPNGENGSLKKGSDMNGSLSSMSKKVWCISPKSELKSTKGSVKVNMEGPREKKGSEKGSDEKNLSPRVLGRRWGSGCAGGG